MDLLRHGHQHEFELCLCANHVGALVPDVFQGGRDVDLLSALCHAVQDHVDEAVCPSASYAVAAEVSGGLVVSMTWWVAWVSEG